MRKVEIGDIVVFKPQCDEVYMWEVPNFGATGSIKSLTHNVGLAQMLGIYLPMCVVDFGLGSYTPVYLEDLKLKEKNETEVNKGTGSGDSISVDDSN